MTPIVDLPRHLNAPRCQQNSALKALKVCFSQPHLNANEMNFLLSLFCLMLFYRVLYRVSCFAEYVPHFQRASTGYKLLFKYSLRFRFSDRENSLCREGCTNYTQFITAEYKCDSLVVTSEVRITRSNCAFRRANERRTKYIQTGLVDIFRKPNEHRR